MKECFNSLLQESGETKEECHEVEKKNENKEEEPQGSVSSLNAHVNGEKHSFGGRTSPIKPHNSYLLQLNSTECPFDLIITTVMIAIRNEEAFGNGGLHQNTNKVVFILAATFSFI